MIMTRFEVLRFYTIEPVKMKHATRIKVVQHQEFKEKYNRFLKPI